MLPGWYGRNFIDGQELNKERKGQMEMDYLSHQRNLVASLLGPDGYLALIMDLPDEFFRMEEKQQLAIWNRILRLINQGERDIAVLAGFRRAVV